MLAALLGVPEQRADDTHVTDKGGTASDELDGPVGSLPSPSIESASASVDHVVRRMVVSPQMCRILRAPSALRSLGIRHELVEHLTGRCRWSGGVAHGDDVSTSGDKGRRYFFSISAATLMNLERHWIAIIMSNRFSVPTRWPAMVRGLVVPDDRELVAILLFSSLVAR